MRKGAGVDNVNRTTRPTEQNHLLDFNIAPEISCMSDIIGLHSYGITVDPRLMFSPMLLSRPEQLWPLSSRASHSRSPSSHQLRLYRQDPGQRSKRQTASIAETWVHCTDDLVVSNLQLPGVVVIQLKTFSGSALATPQCRSTGTPPRFIPTTPSFPIPLQRPAGVLQISKSLKKFAFLTGPELRCFQP